MNTAFRTRPARPARASLALARALVALALALGAAGAACEDDGNSPPAPDGAATSRDAGGLSVDARQRREGGGGGGDPCLRCSLIAGFLAGGGAGLGAGGPMPGGMDMPPGPCAGPGMGMRMPGGGAGDGFSLCNQAVFEGFTQCLQNQCAEACNVSGMGMGPPMCTDGGVGSAPLRPTDTDAGAGRAGASACKQCLTTRCQPQLTACEADQ